MKTITKENFTEIYEPLKETFRHWALVNQSVMKFENYANLNTFNQLFGEDDERLFIHFKQDCDSNFNRFRTYLTSEQINMCILNFHVNKDYIY